MSCTYTLLRPDIYCDAHHGAPDIWQPSLGMGMECSRIGILLQRLNQAPGISV